MKINKTEVDLRPRKTKIMKDIIVNLIIDCPITDKLMAKIEQRKRESPSKEFRVIQRERRK
jgi:hypothetical protein